MTAAIGTAKVLHRLDPTDLRWVDPRPITTDDSVGAARSLVRRLLGEGTDVEVCLFGDLS